MRNKLKEDSEFKRKTEEAMDVVNNDNSELTQESVET